MYVKVRIDDNDVAKNLDGLAADIRGVMFRRKLRDRMDAARRAVAKYPALWRGTLPKGWYKTERQRRKVMALVREGAVPYRRTGTYGRGWRLREITHGYSLETDVEYAKWVGGDQLGNSQARIHQGRWAIATEAVDAEMDKLPAEIQETLIGFLRQRRLLGG